MNNGGSQQTDEKLTGKSPVGFEQHDGRLELVLDFEQLVHVLGSPFGFVDALCYHFDLGQGLDDTNRSVSSSSEESKAGATTHAEGT